MDSEEILTLNELLTKFFREERGLLIRPDGTPSMLITQVEEPKDNQYGEKRKLVKGLPLDGREGSVEEYLDWKNPYKNTIESVVFEENDGGIITQRIELGKGNDEDDFLWMANRNKANKLKDLQNKLKLKEQTVSELQDKLDEKVEETEEFRRDAETVNEKLRSYKSRVNSLSKEVNELRKENEILRKNSERYEAKKREEKGQRDAKMQRAEKQGRDKEKDRLDHAIDGVEAVGELTEEFAKASVGNEKSQDVELDRKVSKINEELGDIKEEIRKVKSGEG